MKIRKTFWKVFGITLLTLFLVFYNLPSETQTKLIPSTPTFFTKNNINLGLDLQGGSQLDYKIDLRNVPEADQETIIEGVKGIIEKRVNGLGVAEPNIYISKVAEETHIIVELAQTGSLSQEDVTKHLGADKILAELTEDEKKEVSLEKAKETVGKTIQLEFKEQKAAGESTEEDQKEADATKEMAQKALDRIKSGSEFSIVGQEEQQASPSKAKYETVDFKFESEMLTAIKDTLSKLEINAVSESVVEVGGSYSIINGALVEEKQLALLKLLESQEAIKNAKEVDISKILIQYTGLETADATVTRSKEAAEQLAKEVRDKIVAAEDKTKAFEEAAKEFSDDKTTKEEGGKVPNPITKEFSDDEAAKEEDAAEIPNPVEEVALAFSTENEISEVIETDNGFEIIKSNAIRTDVKEKQYKYEIISYSLAKDPWQATGLTGEQFAHANFEMDQYYRPYVSIQFNDEGAKLFEEITTRNTGKQVAIFVGGNLISSPQVNEPITGGKAQLSGDFTAEEARSLARDLNTGAIPAPIILTGEYTIGASIGKDALTQSIEAGILGLGLVVLFMVIFYRLMGFIAGISLVIYTSILIFLIKSQLPLGVSIVAAILIFGFSVSKILTNKDSGPEKLISFILACIVFIFLTYIFNTGVVLTLAGTAGIILSMGMAVDANILIFERFKEEIREGKKFDTALENGFNRAWSSIRDSNFSTLITCGILYYFGSSIIKGFAFNLAAGVLVSMFTALMITKTLLKGFIGKKLAEKYYLFGASQKPVNENKFNIIKHTKIWLSISATAVIVSVAAIFTFGLNLGIDFTGGTLMELKFNEPVTKEQIKTSLMEASEKLSTETPPPTPTETPEPQAPADPEAPITPATTISADAASSIKLTAMDIVESGENNFIIKTNSLTPENHDKLIAKAKESLPEFTETRFNTIGPVIGATLLKDAIKAVAVAIVMIVLYIAIAFRKVDKSVSKWKFGTTAIIALLHDVIITTGIFVILGQFTDAEINSLFITAILTVMGYSVNDTIVVFDRLRENLTKFKGESMAVVANKALNQTMGRSLNTSFSTLIALLAVLISGNDSLFFFILALLVGILVGTYSSIFVAAPLLAMWKRKR